MTSCWCKIIACSKWIKIIRINHWTFSTCISTQYGHVRLHVNVKKFVLPSCLHETLKKNYCFKESIVQFFINIIRSFPFIFSHREPPLELRPSFSWCWKGKTLCAWNLCLREESVLGYCRMGPWSQRWPAPIPMNMPSLACT